MELRCDSGRFHGVLTEDYVEVACRSERCGKAPGVVVVHRFNKTTGELIATLRYSDVKEETHGTTDQGISVRSA